MEEFVQVEVAFRNKMSGGAFIKDRDTVSVKMQLLMDKTNT